MKKTLYVCISLDVEEEGLFSGKYQDKAVTLANVPLMRQLTPLHQNYGLPLTLFCAWPVFMDAAATETLYYMRENCAAEIGAHLHHWSTPPLADNADCAHPAVNLVPEKLLEQKLAVLLEAGQRAMGRPITSFRMGRWDLRRPFLNMLAKYGIKVDSSICPLRSFKNGPDHFLAPAQPYWAPLANSQKMLEAPITQIPLFPSLPHYWLKWAGNKKRLDAFHFFGAMSANPVWHSMPVMRRAVNALARRGGNILNLFWHSSELMAGGSPNIPDQKSADALFAKIMTFAAWLAENYEIKGVTMSQLTELPCAENYPVIDTPAKGDW